MRLNYFKSAAFVLLAWMMVALPAARAAVKVVGYATSWSGAASDIQYSKLTHINYAFLIPNSDGSIQAIDNPAKLQSIVSSAHSNGVKVLISVGGWLNGDPSAFVNLSNNSTSRQNFVNNVVNFANQYGLDGVDIDWEWPAGATSNSYGTLMSQLAGVLHGQGKLLTSAVVAYGGGADGIPSSVFGNVDWLNVMDYDNNNFEHSTYASAVTSLDYWKGRGLPASKTVLGVPFYSHPGSYTFAQLISMGANPNADTWNGQGYNGITTIKAKTTLVFDRGVGGIMMWELAQDATGANSLLSAIDQVVKQRQVPTGNQAYFNIINQNSGKAIDLVNGNTANGSNANQYSFNYDSGNQRWALQPTENGDHFKIISWVSGKALCIAGDSTTTGAQLWTWDYTGNNPAQQWDLVDAGNGWFNIKNVRSGLYLDNFNSTADNGKVAQSTPNTSSAQKWRLQPWGDYYFRAEVSGKYIGAVDAPNGSKVVQHAYENQPWYKWHFNSRGDGWFSVQSLYAPGRALCVPAASTTVGKSLHIWDYNVNNIGDQKVRIRPRTNGTYTYYFAHDNLAWDIQGAGEADLVPLTQYTNNDGTAQQFHMERVQ